MTGLELGGFCPVTVVKRHGLLLKARDKAGCVRFNGKVYGFASPEFAQAFASAPEAYLKEVYAVARLYPTSVKLLNLIEVFPSLDVRGLVKIMSGPTTCEFGTQTPTHFVER